MCNFIRIGANQILSHGIFLSENCIKKYDRIVAFTKLQTSNREFVFVDGLGLNKRYAIITRYVHEEIMYIIMTYSDIAKQSATVTET